MMVIKIMVIILIPIIVDVMIAMMMTITLIATKQVKNFMDGAGIKEIWTSGRLCDAEVLYFYSCWEIAKVSNLKKSG